MSDPGRPPKGFKGLFDWLDRFYDAWTASRDIRAPGILLRQTTRGTSRAAVVSDDGGDSTSPTTPTQWDAAVDYKKGDLVYRDLTTEWDDGRQVGVYFARKDAPSGTAGPDIDNVGIIDPAFWSLYAPEATPKFVLRIRGTGDFLGHDQLIVIDCGRDGGRPIIQLFADASDTSRSIRLAIDDIPAVSGHEFVSLQEDTFCYGVGLKKITWLRTDPYDA